MSSGEFVKIDAEHVLEGGSDDVAWSPEETVLLLEGIELFDENWIKVAEHVGTRSKEQCVLHFLQLPIEDQFLDADATKLGPLQYAPSPFSQSDNPVMSVVAFLASVANPGVASAAARAAMKEMGVEMTKNGVDDGMPMK